MIGLKAVQILRYNFRQQTQWTKVDVEEGLGQVYDDETGIFRIFNEAKIKFTLTPSRGCLTPQLLVLTISSGPLNRINRDRWRQDLFRYSDKVRHVFLVSSAPSDKDQVMLEKEHEEHDDIVQTSLEDGHRKLGYKILTGYIWTWLHCSGAKFVGKTDDNVVLNMDKLLIVLERWGDTNIDFVTCDEPKKNLRTLRGSRGENSGPHMVGNWSMSKEDLEADIMPDFCSGFLYLTSPKVGAALTQVGLALYNKSEMFQIEDPLITGVLRESLGADIRMLEEGSLKAELWKMTGSHCPFMTMTKLTFYNEMVVSKRSSRSNIAYVGSVTSLDLWRFYLCMLMEVGIERYLVPELVPNYLWEICSRSKGWFGL